MGKGHALPGVLTSRFLVRSKAPAPPEVAPAGSKDGWEGMALPHEGSSPGGGRLGGIGDAILPYTAN